MLKLKPLGSFYQVRLLSVKASEAVTPGGLVLPEKAIEKTRIAEVIAAGAGQYNPWNGGRFDSGIREGDLVYVMQHGPIKIIHHPDFKDEPETFLVAESDVYAIYLPREEAIAKGLVKDPEAERLRSAEQAVLELAGTLKLVESNTVCKVENPESGNCGCEDTCKNGS